MHTTYTHIQSSTEHKQSNPMSLHMLCVLTVQRHSIVHKEIEAHKENSKESQTHTHTFTRASPKNNKHEADDNSRAHHNTTQSNIHNHSYTYI